MNLDTLQTDIAAKMDSFIEEEESFTGMVVEPGMDNELTLFELMIECDLMYFIQIKLMGYFLTKSNKSIPFGLIDRFRVSPYCQYSSLHHLPNEL